MEIAYLQEFIGLVLHRNFTSTAREFHISQPTLSRHIASLEQELNVKIFFDSQPLNLTAAGEIAFEAANDIVTSYERLNGKLEKLRSQAPERIRIQDLLHFESLYSIVSEAVKLTKQECPYVHFEYDSEVNNEEQESALTRNRIDIAFRFSISEEPSKIPKTSDSIRCIANPGFCGELRFGVRRDAPVLKKKDIILKDFENYSFCLPAKRYCSNLRDDLIRVCQEAGFFPKIKLIPIDNIQNFYNSNFGEDIFLAPNFNGFGHEAIGEDLGARLAFIKPRDRADYIYATILTRKNNNSIILDNFINLIEEVSLNTLGHSPTRRPKA